MKRIGMILGLLIFATSMASARSRRMTRRLWNSQVPFNGISFDEYGNAVVKNGLEITSTMTVNGVVINSLSSEVTIDTATTMTITDRYMVIIASGSGSGNQKTITSSADPFLSTTTYTQGTIVTIICSSGTVILGDNGTQSGSRLSLGSTTRSVGDRDNITIRLRNDYWEELGYTDNQ